MNMGGADDMDIRLCSRALICEHVVERIAGYFGDSLPRIGLNCNHGRGSIEGRWELIVLYRFLT